jgi:hypothetical protein
VVVVSSIGLGQGSLHMNAYQQVPIQCMPCTDHVAVVCSTKWQYCRGYTTNSLFNNTDTLLPLCFYFYMM